VRHGDLWYVEYIPARKLSVHGDRWIGTGRVWPPVRGSRGWGQRNGGLVIRGHKSWQTDLVIPKDETGSADAPSVISVVKDLFRVTVLLRSHDGSLRMETLWPWTTVRVWRNW